jgi:CRISPR type I-E-associated protein CasB/Cse2
MQEAVALARRLDALRTDVRETDPRIDVALGLARVLAHVREDSTLRPMRAAGWSRFPSESVRSSGDDQPKLAEVRFRRLLEVRQGEELVTAFVRLIDLLGNTVNVSDLSYAFVRWDKDEVRRKWAFDYYAASGAAPQQDDTQPSEDDA